jgi:RecB family exonuclease
VTTTKAPLRELPPLSDELRELLDDEIARRVEDDGAKTIGQTALSLANLCPRSAAFYFIFGGGTETHATARGTLAHLHDEQLRDYMLEEGETTIPPEVAKDRMMALIAEQVDAPLPEHEQEALRIYAWNAAWTETVDPQALVCNETNFAMALNGWVVRGRIDRADILPDSTILITDRKSGLNLPSQEGYERGPASFQPKTYALLVAEGFDGDGLPLGEGLSTFRTKIELPRRMNEESGELANREATFTRAELHDFRVALERLLAVIDHGITTGDFAAVPGSHCAYCPASQHCPIDAGFRTVPGTDGPPERIDSIQDIATAEQLATEKVFIDARSAGIQKALREWSKDNGAIHVGRDLEFDFGYQESRSVKDYDELEAAIQRTTEFGEPFDLSDHIKVKRSTPFKKRRINREENDGS